MKNYKVITTIYIIKNFKKLKEEYKRLAIVLKTYNAENLECNFLTECLKINILKKKFFLCHGGGKKKCCKGFHLKVFKTSSVGVHKSRQ